MPYITLEEAIQRLYDDASLTDELTDGPAQTLLSWAEGALSPLVERHADESPFEAAFKALRILTKTINRLTWERMDLDADGLRERLSQLADQSQPLGYTLDQARADAFISQQESLDEAQAVTALIGLFGHGQGATQPGEPEPAAAHSVPVEAVTAEAEADTSSASQTPVENAGENDTEEDHKDDNKPGFLRWFGG